MGDGSRLSLLTFYLFVGANRVPSPDQGARTSFNSTGLGGCSGASFDGVGSSLLRSHVINVHFDFDLSGCAGTFGNASADLRVELRLYINPPSVTARLVNHSIDGVSSPFSAGDGDIRNGLSESLNQQFGKDLLNRSIPKGITVIAGIVETNGDVNLYIAPICAPSSFLLQSGGSSLATALGQMQRLRDEYLQKQHGGRALTEMVAVLGPSLLATVRDERDGPHLREAISHLLSRTFTDAADLQSIAARLEETIIDLQSFLSHPSLAHDRRWIDRFTRHAINYARHDLKSDVTFDHALSHVRRVIHEESRRCGDTNGGHRLPD